MLTKHPGYWAITGTLIGFGLISFDIYFIAYPCLLVGLGLIIYGVIRLGIGGIWAALLGFGTLPALMLVWDIVTAPPPCQPGGLSLPPHTAQLACSYIPPSYFLFAVLFGAIALMGGAWPLLRRLRTRHGAPTR